MARICCKSGLPINQAEDDSEKDCELLAELERLLEHDEKRFSHTKNQWMSLIWVLKLTKKR